MSRRGGHQAQTLGYFQFLNSLTTTSWHSTTELAYELSKKHSLAFITAYRIVRSWSKSRLCGVRKEFAGRSVFYTTNAHISLDIEGVCARVWGDLPEDFRRTPYKFDIPSEERYQLILCAAAWFLWGRQDGKDAFNRWAEKGHQRTIK